MAGKRKTTRSTNPLSRLFDYFLRRNAHRRSEHRRRFSLERFGFDPYRVLTVDSARIRNAYTGEKVDKAIEMGRIHDGDWDKTFAPFESLDIWGAFSDHFIDHRPWRETEFYKRMLDLIESGTPRWDCRSQADLDERYRGIDDLYNEIRTNGYRPQDELPPLSRVYIENVDEITVSIARDGELLFEDGRHRFSIARILKLSQIPVQVVWRHQKWFEFRESIRAQISSGAPPPLPLPHPDLSDLPVAKATCSMELILANLTDPDGPILDLGARFGGRCHRLENKGFDCVAAEINKSERPFTEKLREIEGKRFPIVSDAVDLPALSDNFNTVLALDSFERFGGIQRELDRFGGILENLDMSSLFITLPNDAASLENSASVAQKRFIDFILENSCLGSADKLSDTPGGRDLYRLIR